MINSINSNLNYNYINNTNNLNLKKNTQINNLNNNINNAKELNLNNTSTKETNSISNNSTLNNNNISNNALNQIQNKTSNSVSDKSQATNQILGYSVDKDGFFTSDFNEAAGLPKDYKIYAKDVEKYANFIGKGNSLNDVLLKILILLKHYEMLINFFLNSFLVKIHILIKKTLKVCQNGFNTIVAIFKS